MWKFRGRERPTFAVEPGPGEESVWDYPRPPALKADSREVLVFCRDTLIAKSQATIRVLETASPPTFYIPREAVQLEYLAEQVGNSFCEWKGQATYWSFHSGDIRVRNIGWSYEHPSQEFQQIAGYLSFYPALTECLVDGERVRPQPGEFYGGWVTDEVVGPFKGQAGTGGW